MATEAALLRLSFGLLCLQVADNSENSERPRLPKTEAKVVEVMYDRWKKRAHLGVSFR